MTEEMRKSRPINLSLDFDSPEDIETIYVNATRVSRFQYDVAMDFGNYSVHDFVSTLKRLEQEVTDGEIDISVNAKGIVRIAMSPGTFYFLRRQVEEIYKAYEKAGTWKDMGMEG
ncbi:MAG: hypothetical protein RX318_04565 [bacterium]|nr:hypothetical protein [bacterium]